MRHVQRSILPLLILAVAAPLRAADRQLIASTLEKAYRDQNLVLRTSTSGATVRYSADGRLVSGGKPGPWTLDTNIQCTGVEFKRDDLVIKAKRLYFVYDKKLQALRPYFGPPVRVEIDTRGEPLSLTTLQEAMTKVFVTDSENQPLIVPDYWKDYFLHPTQGSILPLLKPILPFPLPSAQKLTGENSIQTLPMSSIYKLALSGSPGEKRNLIPGRLIYKTKPPYTPEARKAGVEGTVIISVVVDASGRVIRDSIVTPLGMGLDDNAAQALQNWKYKPSTVGGKPVPVLSTVEFDFRLR